MKKYVGFGFFCFFTLFSAVFARGQGFTGPGANNVRVNGSPAQPVMVSRVITVSEARNLPKDSWVILSGNIINSLPGGKYYTFRDSSGEIAVEIERKVWRGLSAGVNDTVEISGKVDIERGQVSIEAKSITGPGTVTVVPGRAVTVRQPITVREARALPNESWVILTGTIVSAGRSENYTFRDSSGGDITVKIERKVWRGLSVGANNQVTIYGELKISRSQASIEVKAIQ